MRKTLTKMVGAIGMFAANDPWFKPLLSDARATLAREDATEDELRASAEALHAQLRAPPQRT